MWWSTLFVPDLSERQLLGLLAIESLFRPPRTNLVCIWKPPISMALFYSSEIYLFLVNLVFSTGFRRLFNFIQVNHWLYRASTASFQHGLFCILHGVLIIGQSSRCHPRYSRLSWLFEHRFPRHDVPSFHCRITDESLVDTDIARNCAGLSLCQQDTTIIHDAEIAANILNECGRTELTGNIDVGESTENQLATGTLMTMTIHQVNLDAENYMVKVNTDRAGPYIYDLDQLSEYPTDFCSYALTVPGNAGIISQNLTVTYHVPGVNSLSKAKTQTSTSLSPAIKLACTCGTFRTTFI